MQAPHETGAALTAPLYTAASPGQQYHLHILHLHTGKSLAILNHFLRDHWTGEVQQFDPRGIVCGYLCLTSNAALCERSRGVAEH